ncbi:oligosaccharide flippase family protein [Flavobacterium sp. U410]|jgi:O-antigen/teichoic acid export membrane protein
MEKRGFHRIIFKNVGFFGISQLVTIGVRLVTNKFAAIFLGSAGIGIIGLLENILTLIQSVTVFGLPASSVREVALVDDSTQEENAKESKLLQILYKWSWISGVLGVVLSLLFSKKISLEVFETTSYQSEIVALSLYFLFTSVSSIRLAVLQGKKKILYIVKYNLILSVLSSLLAVCFYYLWRINGIIPVFVGTAFIGFILSLFFTRNYKTSSVSLKTALSQGLPMVKLGLLLSLSGILGQICFYIIRWYLKEYFSLEILGLYQVGNTFLVSYLGLVFTTMANDFYPRLCNYETDKKKFNDLINDQTEVALSIVLPAILFLYLGSPLLLKLLYSEQFLEVLKILHIGLLSVILKAVVWPLGFIPLVKGDKFEYFKQNILSDVIHVILSLVLVHFLGLNGIGIAITGMFLVSFLYNYYVAVSKYEFEFRKDTLKTIFVALILVLIALVSVSFFGFTFQNFVVWITLAIAFWNSLQLLKKVI